MRHDIRGEKFTGLDVITSVGIDQQNDSDVLVLPDQIDRLGDGAGKAAQSRVIRDSEVLRCLWSGACSACPDCVHTALPVAAKMVNEATENGLVGHDQMNDTRRLWAAGIFPWGTEIFGGMWDTDRLYRTRAEAIRDIEGHAIKMGLLPITWSAPDEKLTIGRTHKPGNESLTYLVLVRSARLPDDM